MWLPTFLVWVKNLLPFLPVHRLAIQKFLLGLAPSCRLLSIFIHHLKTLVSVSDVGQS